MWFVATSSESSSPFVTIAGSSSLQFPASTPPSRALGPRRHACPASRGRRPCARRRARGASAPPELRLALQADEVRRRQWGGRHVAQPEQRGHVRRRRARSARPAVGGCSALGCILSASARGAAAVAAAAAARDAHGRARRVSEPRRSCRLLVALTRAPLYRDHAGAASVRALVAGDDEAATERGEGAGGLLRERRRRGPGDPRRR